MDELRWPLWARPGVMVATQAPLVARGFEPVYRAPTHALHLHAYEGTMRIGQRTHPLSPGTLTFSPAQVETSYDLPRRGIHWCIHFEAVGAPAGAPMIQLPLVQSLGKLAVQAIARLTHLIRLRSWLDIAQQLERPTIEAAMSTACQELLIWTSMVARMNGGVTGQEPHPAVTELIEHIDRNLHRSLGSDELLQRSGLSGNYVARLFRRDIGSTIPTYILGRRIALANLLLTTTNLSVKEVAARVGLPNPQHFNKQFRRLTGVSPTVCRSTSDRRLTVNSNESMKCHP